MSIAAAIEEARKTMLKHNQNMILIYNEEKFVGIFTIRDYIVGLEKYQKNLFRHNVEGMMSTSIVSIKPDMNIFEANDFMVKNEYKNYPVIAGEKVLGILNQKDLCVKIFEYLEKKARKK